MCVVNGLYLCVILLSEYIYINLDIHNLLFFSRGLVLEEILVHSNNSYHESDLQLMPLKFNILFPPCILRLVVLFLLSLAPRFITKTHVKRIRTPPNREPDKFTRVFPPH